MKRIRILKVIFDVPITGKEIPLFRGAIIKKVGEDAHLFHNHNGKGFYYRYPMIQYKTITGNAAIVCIEQGIDEIHRIFSQPDWSVTIGQTQKELKIKSLKVNTYVVNVWDKFFNYRIFNYIPFNEENYKKYKTLTEQQQKKEFLEKLMIAHIIGFAAGINWRIEQGKQVKVKILNILKEKKVKYKGIPLISFDLEFQTNVSIPENLGIGKGVSKGFGHIFKMKNKKNQK